MRTTATLLLLTALLALSSCGPRETNAPNHNILTGYLTQLDEQQFMVSGQVFQTDHVTIWSLNGHRMAWTDFAVGMYVQVVASKLAPFETWVATQPEPLD